ncbi:MAG: right-handed parallel beta-helix repeat-containing protein [Planctomycetes bacterium]|nr:right-handed parallel beta-helix repeat-containing protein [Planctomycetota bacterium]
MLSSHKSVKWAVTAIAVLAAIMLTSAAAQGGPVLYVDDDAPPGGDGTSWNTAYRFLQDGLTDACAGGIAEIRVGQGIYLPDRDEANPGGTGDREATFQLCNAVALMGGYAGFGAPDPDARDIELYETILSGDLLGNDGPGDFEENDENSYNVTTGSGTDGTAVLDGFSVNAGNGNAPGGPGDGQPFWSGGGMVNLTGSPTVTGCFFIANSAGAGGGMANRVGSNPSVTGCTFGDNMAVGPLGAGAGGGMVNLTQSSPSIIDCTFSGNMSVADAGGGMANAFNSNPIVTNCTFDHNTAVGSGGMFNRFDCSPKVTNCTFNNNTATMFQAGGMGNFDNSNPTVTDCTFDSNIAQTHGGAMYNSSSNPTVTNCLFSGNISATRGGGMANSNASSPTVTNCTFIGNSAEGGADGGGGISTSGNQCFVSVTNCVFVGNFAQFEGGAIMTVGGSITSISSSTLVDNESPNAGGGLCTFGAGSETSVSNCVIYWNTAPVHPQILNVNGGVTYVSSSNTEGGYDGKGNIDANPLFIRIPDPGPDGEWGTADDDYGDLHFLPGSLCIDAADNNAVPDGIEFDLGGNPRFVDDPKTQDTGLGSCPIVDMGAYEFQEGLVDCPCAWDLDGTGSVGILDLLALLAAWGTDPVGPPDFDGDGNVGILDLLTLLANWGPCP